MICRPTFLPLLFLSLFLPLSNCFLPGPVGGIFHIEGRTVHHAEQTENAIHDFLKGEPFNVFFGPFDKFIPARVKQARQTIVKGNKDVDWAFEPNFREKDVGAAHFDDELFQAGQDRLMILRSQMIDYLRAGDAELARIFLGRQLHALQDFYSHSNWVEENLHRNDISEVIGRPGPSPDMYPKSSHDTCTEFCLETSVMSPAKLAEYKGALKCHRDCFVGDQKDEQVLEGAICAKRKCKSTDKFCKEAPGACSPNQKYACEFNMINFNEITSGYYFVPDGKGGGKPGTVKPKGKCAHGGMNDNGTVGTEGINKDSTLVDYAPHWYYHFQAAALAEKATLRYIKDLATDWPDVDVEGTLYPQPALSERELRILFGLGSGTLAFVIDTTASMGSVINAVRDSVTTIVKRVNGTDTEPTSYVLMAYNDPVGTDLFQSKDADAFIAHLSTLYARGGGLCPEPSLGALSQALAKVDSYSTVFLFTDAGASDPENLSAVLDKAKKKKAKVTVFEWLTCSTADIYKRVAAETLGGYYGLTDRSSAASLAEIALQLIQSDSVAIYSDAPVTSASSTSLVRRASADTEFAVDTGLSEITISASGPAMLTVTRPDGTTVKEGDSDVKSYMVGDGFTFIAIDKPQAGTWTAHRSDTSSTGLSISANTFITFNNFEFVEMSGHHPGWFSILGDPVPGTKYTVMADLEGDFVPGSLEFTFRDSITGKVVQDVVLKQFVSEPGADPEHYWFGESIEIPKCGGFSVYVTGKDLDGGEFQRMFPAVFGTPGGCGEEPERSSSSSSSSLPTSSSPSSVLSSSSGVSFSSSVSSSASSSTSKADPVVSQSQYPTPQQSEYSSYDISSKGHSASRNYEASDSPRVTPTSPPYESQGVYMTQTVVTISTVSTCHYTTLVAPCPTNSYMSWCMYTTSSISLVPVSTTTAMVPVTEETSYPGGGSGDGAGGGGDSLPTAKSYPGSGGEETDIASSESKTVPSISGSPVTAGGGKIAVGFGAGGWWMGLVVGCMMYAIGTGF